MNKEREKRGDGMAHRIQTRVSDELGADLADWAKKLGITQSQLAGMAIHAGFGSILRAIAPEYSISPDKMADIIKAMQDKGYDMEKIPDGIKK